MERLGKEFWRERAEGLSCPPPGEEVGRTPADIFWGVELLSECSCTVLQFA